MGGPVDDSIPDGWEDDASEELLYEWKSPITDDCFTDRKVREIKGPKRKGHCIPEGKPKIGIFYFGKCEWTITQWQDGKVVTYQLVRLVAEEDNIPNVKGGCKGKPRHEVTKGEPYWKPIGSEHKVCSLKELKKIRTSRPCPEDGDTRANRPVEMPIDEVPDDVKKALQGEIAKAKKAAKDGPDVMDSPIDLSPVTNPPSKGPVAKGQTKGEAKESVRKTREKDETDAEVNPYKSREKSEQPHSGQEKVDEPGKDTWEEWLKLIEKMDRDWGRDIERDY
ncbi:MAG: hypothetical protein OK449_10565 [Thaumarchaeota archaeon]|nr:hypothetical protein [Nitrososphaerota archaeon]